MVPRIEPPAGVYIGESAIGGDGRRGVFAKVSISAGSLIEECPVIDLDDPKDRDRLRKTGLVNYYFLWGEGRVKAAICLGWGSIYNHSFEPNARYEKSMEIDRMNFYALRDIAPGEEITVNYNGDPTDKRRLRVPGIPAAAGGPLPSGLPWPIEGLRRRLKSLFPWSA